MNLRFFQTLFLSSILFLFGVISDLQANTYDSLKLLLALSSGKAKANLEVRLSAMLSDTVPEKSFHYALDAFRESVQSGDLKTKADARKLIGEYFLRNRKYISALDCYLSSLKLYTFLNDREGTLGIYQSIGTLSSFLRDYANAVIYYRKGLALAQSMKDLKWTAIFLQELGRVDQTKGNIGSALEQYNQALELFQQGGYRYHVINVYNSIGSIYLDQGKYDTAIEFYKQLLTRKDPELRSQMGTIYTRLAHAYEQKKNFREALACNQQALKIRHEMAQMEDFNSSLINMAGDYFFLNRADSGWIYMNEGIRLARAKNRTYLTENGYRMIYRYFEFKGDYSQALTYYQKYRETSDSILIDKNRGDIAILEASQRLQTIEETNNLLARENEIQSLSLNSQRFRNNFLQVVLSISIIIIIYSGFRYIRNIRAKQEKQLIYSKMSKEMEHLEATNTRIGEQERQYRFLAENSLDFITRFDKNMKRLYASPSSVKLYGYTPEEMLQKSTYDLTVPEFYSYAEERLREVIRARMPKQFIYVSRKKSGEEFWVESIINPVFNSETGEIEEFVGVTRDIQERRKKELEIMEGTAQKENLLKEIHHRVKNNFAILVSLINMQKDQAQAPELVRALTDLQLRIRTMALVHEMLYRSKDFEKISFSGYIRSLSSVITGTFNRRDINLLFDVEEITMDIEAAIPLGLIINELLTNAYRHAFPGDRPGTIQIGFHKIPEPEGFELTIGDDGTGMPSGFSPENCKTMGLQIVQILVKQLEGELHLEGPPGTLFKIFFSTPS
jgi:PAS domain S-box-containing protein